MPVHPGNFTRGFWDFSHLISWFSCVMPDCVTISATTALYSQCRPPVPAVVLVRTQRISRLPGCQILPGPHISLINVGCRTRLKASRYLDSVREPQPLSAAPARPTSAAQPRSLRPGRHDRLPCSYRGRSIRAASLRTPAVARIHPLRDERSRARLVSLLCFESATPGRSVARAHKPGHDGALLRPWLSRLGGRGGKSGR